MKASDSRRVRGATSVVALAFVAGILGCGAPAPQPTRGEIKQNGRPAEGAVVTLFPIGKPWTGVDVTLPRGEVGPDGIFTVTTETPGDGATPGEYKLTIRWPQEPTKKPRTAEEIEASLGADPVDRLKGKYSDPHATPYTVTVGFGPTTLAPIDLPRP